MAPQWPCGHVWRHSGLSHGGKDITGIHWIEAMNAPIYPTMYIQDSPHNKELSSTKCQQGGEILT